MSSNQLDEEQIFQVARKITEAELRSQYLDQICAGDQALRDRVEALLDVHEKEESLLQSNDAVAPTEDLSPITETTGTKIGRYKLLQNIGEGGFGVVYMAEQARPVRRKVALKIIKPGMDTKAVVARFEAERQALAMMDHPNIARVLDGGATETGRPYFVMELVNGVPITDYCDKNHLPTEERLKLFNTVCKAVQHAHHKGIIHRDLKPSNILVSLADGQPVVKVIDFGVAKATNQQLTEKTLFTAYGQMVGTPQYMSPEQAEMSCLDVDTRSDVYSLGVLLYELLTGTTPLASERLRAAGYAEMQRIIKDEEPPKPSTRLSTSGDKLTVIAKHRAVSPEKLKHQVQGDLDWIVMKALDKDRSRRYESPHAIALDLKRYQQGEPVDARPPTLGYRTAKYIRRNQLLLIVVGIVSLSLGLGLAGTIGMAVEAKKQQAKAELNAAIAESEQTRAEKARNESETHVYNLLMDDAAVATDQGDRLRAQKILTSLANRDCRSIEWTLVKNRCTSPRGLSLEVELDDAAEFVDFSPDGAKVVASLRNGKVLLVDCVSGLKTTIASGTPNRPPTHYSVSFSSQGDSLLYHSADGPLFYAIEPGSNRRASMGMGSSYARFSPNQNDDVVAFLNSNNEVVILNRELEEPIRLDSAGSPPTEGIEFALNSSVMATLDQENCVRTFSTKTGELLGELPMEFGVRHFAISPNGKLIAVAPYSGSRSIRVFDLDSGNQICELEGHSNRVWQLEFANDGRTLVSSARDGTIRFWDIESATQKNTLHAHPGKSCFAISPDGRQIATAGFDQRLIIWDVASCGDRTLPLDRPSIEDIVINDQGTTLAALSFGSEKVLIWDLPSCEPRESLKLSAAGRALDISTKNHVAAGMADGSVTTWDPDSLESTLKLDSIQPVRTLKYSPDGNTLAIAGQGGVVFYDVASNIVTDTRCPLDFVRSLAWSPDGTTLVAGGHYAIVVWDNSSNCWLDKMLEGHAGQVNCLAFSSGPRNVLASSSQDRTIRLWDCKSWRLLETLDAHADTVWDIAFAPDGKSLISTSIDDRLRVWDVDHLESRATFFGHRDGIKAFAISQAAGYLVTGGFSDGQLRLWRISEVNK